MKMTACTPVVNTDRIEECKEFYTKYFGFEVTFASDWYVNIQSPGEKSFDIGFLKPNHESQPPIFQPAYNEGISFSIYVESADEAYAELSEAGVPILHELADEAWGERHFVVVDPAGVPLNICHMIAPTEEHLVGYAEGHAAV